MRLLTLREAAEYLDISTQHAGTLCKRGKLDCIKVKGHWQVDLVSLRQYEAKRQRRHAQREILSDKDKVWALYQKYGTITLAAKSIDCPVATFNGWFHRHGLKAKRGHQTVSKEMFYKTVRRAYSRCDRCPPNCPGWLADRDCLNADVPCIYEEDDDGRNRD